VSSTDFYTTDLVNWTVIKLRSSKCTYHQSCWRHRVFLRQRTAVDADHNDHRGGWTKTFDGKSSTGQKRNFTYATCIWRARWGWSNQTFV